MTYLLDTDTCIYLIKRKPTTVIEMIKSKQPEQIAVSSITVAELEYGASGSMYPERSRMALLNFLMPFVILDFDRNAAATYGTTRRGLEKSGRPIGPLDLLLAAQALAGGLVLVTNNVKEFQRVEGLRVENWA